MEHSHTLWLTQAEKKAFGALTDALRERWTVTDETLSYKDSEKARELRFMIARFHDPTLLAVREKFKEVKTDEEFLTLLRSIDLAALSEVDLGQIMFAVGPDAISALVLSVLFSTDSDDDLVMVANFTELRHELLESLTLVS